MVVFNCNACGESLKKSQVEKHYQTVCRRCEVISCVDCGKDFWGDDYKEHIKCISEEEKYSGKNYKPKPNANKGELKQEAWLQKVQNAIDKANPAPRLKDVLERIKEYPNIPRKKVKFENFLGNSLRVWDQKLSGQVWDLLMMNVEQEEKAAPAENGEISTLCVEVNTCQEKLTDKTETSEHGAHQVEMKRNKRERKEERRKKSNKKEKKDAIKEDNFANAKLEVTLSCDEPEINGHKQKKKKKRRIQEDMEVGPEKKKRTKEEDTDDSGVVDIDQNSETAPADQQTTNKKVKTTFNWDQVIYAVLRKKEDQELSLKRLKKKVIGEYYASGAHVTSEEKLWAKFEKKVKNNPNLRVLKEKVKLVTRI